MILIVNLFLVLIMVHLIFSPYNSPVRKPRLRMVSFLPTVTHYALINFADKTSSLGPLYSSSCLELGESSLEEKSSISFSKQTAHCCCHHWVPCSGLVVRTVALTRSYAVGLVSVGPRVKVSREGLYLEGGCRSFSPSYTRRTDEIRSHRQQRSAQQCLSQSRESAVSNATVFFLFILLLLFFPPSELSLEPLAC